MGKGSAPANQNITQTTSNIGEAQKPYYNTLMQTAQGLTLGNLNPPKYENERIAGFTPEQQKVQQDILGQQTPGQFGTATNLATAAGLGSLSAGQYDPTQFNAQQIGLPDLNYFQMQGPQSFTQSGMAQQYMSPFIQQALEPQMREALHSAKRGQLAEDLGAARQGSYGGSRQLLASMERERNLGQQLGDIQARGLQTAFEQAQGQFNTESAARQNAALQNLQAALGVQQLGATTGLDALKANQQSNLEAQRLGEQSRQFGADLGLRGLAQTGQMAQTLGNLGQMQGQTDLSRLNQQQTTAAQQQALNQQYLDTHYQDYLRDLNYPMQQLQQYANLLSGVPAAKTVTETATGPSPSIASQIMGTGLGALGMYKTLSGGG